MCSDIKWIRLTDRTYMVQMNEREEDDGKMLTKGQTIMSVHKTGN